MFFKKQTPPPSAPSAEELAAIARQQQTAKLKQALDSEPSFKVMTVDGLGWICPYTATVIPAPFGYAEPALKHLLTTQPWTRTQRKSLEQLNAVRWLAWLRPQLPDEQRLQILGADRRWLNPFSGKWERLQRLHQEITEDCTKDIAVALSRSPEANQPGAQMLSGTALSGITSRKETEVSHHQLDLGTSNRHATVRRSGEKTTAAPAIGEHADEDLHKASSIIHKMLSPMPDIPGYGLMVHYEPHSSVGGDFYDCADLGNGRLLLTVGDVTGHGVQGAMVVVAALKSLRHVLKQTDDLVEILARLTDDLKSDLLAGQFITVFAAILDVQARTLTGVCAGHHAAVRIGTARNVVMERFGGKGPGIGLVPGATLRKLLKPTTIQLDPGDLVLVWTDGLTECANDQGEEFGDWRTMGAALSCVEKDYPEAVAQVVAEARTWGKGSFPDDCTVLALKLLPEAAPAG